MLLRCEAQTHDDSLREAVAESLRDICKLRGSIEFVATNTLPNDGKVIEDTRPIG